MAYLEGAGRLEVDLLRVETVSRQEQLDLVLARLDAEALERPIEFVDSAGVRPVDKHLGLLRRDLQPYRRCQVVHAALGRISNTDLS